MRQFVFVFIAGCVIGGLSSYFLFGRDRTEICPLEKRESIGKARERLVEREDQISQSVVAKDDGSNQEKKEKEASSALNIGPSMSLSLSPKEKEKEEEFVGKSLGNNQEALKNTPQGISQNISQNISLLEYPKDVWVHSEPFRQMDRELKKIQGRYTGKMKIPSFRNELHDVVMDINYQQVSKEEGGELSGSFSLQISREGQVYSDVNGTGSNNNIRRLNEKDKKIKGFIVDVHSEDFIHFYFVSGEGDTLKGNYYKAGRFFASLEMDKH